MSLPGTACQVQADGPEWRLPTLSHQLRDTARDEPVSPSIVCATGQIQATYRGVMRRATKERVPQCP